MSKLPVAATVSRTYGFLLGELGTIVRIVWAPLLIGVGLSYLYGAAAVDAVLNVKTNPTAVRDYAPVQFVIVVTSILTSVMATAALLRVVLFGDRKPGLWVYLWTGAAEMRLILVLLLLMVAALAATLAGALVLGFLAMLATAVPGMMLLFEVALFVGVPALAVWIAMRLSLVAPTVLAENNLGVERSWQLMRGSALSMLGVVALTILPFGIFTTLVSLAIIGPDLPPLPDLKAMAKLSQDELKQAAAAFETGVYRAIRLHWTEIHILNFMGSIVSTALFAGATGNAYNALTDQQSRQ